MAFLKPLVPDYDAIEWSQNRIHDASSGKLADGLLDVRKLRRRQAWERSEA
jgi:hypothetical protein